MYRKVPPRLTRAYLQRATTSYLARYAAPRAHVRRVMLRRIDASIKEYGGSRDEAIRLLDDVLELMVRVGALNDLEYARGKARTLLRRGIPTRQVEARLCAKGVEKTLIQQCFVEIEEEQGPEIDLQAARAYARRRGLGPYSRSRKDLKKDLAKMARAGFSYGVSKTVLNEQAHH